MRLTNKRNEYIKNEVIHLLIYYNIKCIPVSGFELAVKMGIVLVPYSSLSSKKYQKAMEMSTDGFYVEPGDGKEYIFYNDAKGYKRSNMTILHEIGHAVLGHTEDTDHEIAEAEAGFFACYATAPSPLIHKLDNKSIRSISNTFDISYEAAENALIRYRKWIEYGPSYYLSYELALIKQVQINTSKGVAT